MSDEPTTRHKAGLFDIRTIIGSLLGIYGVIVLLTGLLGNDAKVENAKAINTYVGAGLIVASAVFLLWVRLRPIVVPEEQGSSSTHGH